MTTTAVINASERRVMHGLPQDCKASLPKYLSNKLFLFFPCVISFFLITIIILLVLYAVERNTTRCDRTSSNISVDNKNVCLSRYCIKAANNILESIDESVDPCENFYQFTCGTWIKNSERQSRIAEQDILSTIEADMKESISDLLSTSSVSKTVEPKAIANARRLYASCINEEAIERDDVDALLSLITEEFGGWPILQGSTWDDSTFNFPQLWLKLSQYNNAVFYHTETKIDKRSTSTYRIRIGLSHLDLGYRGFYTDGSSLAPIYREFIRDFVLELTNSSSMIDADIHDIFRFEKDVAECHQMADGHFVGKTVRTTVKNLSKTINTNFDFTAYLHHLYLWGHVTLTDHDIVVINNVESIRNISLLITQRSPRILQNYMIWRFVIHRISNMPKRFRTILDKLKRAALGINNELSRTITCVDCVNDHMGFAVSKLYLNQSYDHIARHESIEIVNNIRNTFIDMINQSMWMDAVSKQKTIDKTQAIVAKVGYPDYLDSENITKLENIYAEYNFHSSHMRNILLLLQLNAKENLRRLYQPVDRQEWIKYAPTTTNAFYHPLSNTIVVPAGILRPPFFHKDAPKYLNYGAIGSIVGHEITHGFDELRRHIDKDGKRFTSWSNETIDMFHKRSQCIIEQYNNYTVTQVNLQVDGKRTREENIADNDGLKKAFYAYRKWSQLQGIVEKRLPGLTNYSPEQIFFISFGQSWCSKMTDKSVEDLIHNDNHSPSQFRINGPTSNFVEFDRVFSCKPGQSNSRVNKCNVW